jgi:hypothetical protein
MTKEEYGDLLAEIGGGNRIEISARAERETAEQTVLARHDNELWALLSLGDALHQFYRDSLGLVALKMPGVSLSDEQIAMTHWHVACFRRFAAAFDLMAHGYYPEAMVLARDLWEVALTLAAIKKQVVPLTDILATEGGARREREQRSRETDYTVRRALIAENTALSGNAKSAVETFVGLANLATHKSKLLLGMNLSRSARREPTPLFPHFDKEWATVAHNVLYLATWSIVSTLPYLDFALGRANSQWDERYGRVQLAFREGLATGPNPTVQAWPEIIDNVFA